MTSNPPSTVKIDQESEQVLLPFFYFDIFSYPLKLDEVYVYNRFTGFSKGKIKSLLQKLIENGFLYRIKDYYLLHNQPDWVSKREENNQRAQRFLPKAQKMTRLISKFPFVRAVFISGSLSKHTMPKGGDIDYFIVTKPGRLWVARTFLILFKKIFLLNSHKYFCVNYFVDKNHLEIEEKNLFTATEIVTLLPFFGAQYYHQFYTSNNWVKKYYPNFPKRSTSQTPSYKPGLLQSFGEYFLNGRLGSWLDQFFMEKTLAYWHKKFKSFDKNTFAIALKSRQYISKHHPLDFQSKVLKEYQKRIGIFEAKHHLQLNADPK